MARRSYLQRLAEPVAAGEAALFPLHRPDAAEARPATAVKSPLGPAVAAAPALRRTPGSAVTASASGRAASPPTALRPSSPTGDAQSSEPPEVDQAPRTHEAPPIADRTETLPPIAARTRTSPPIASAIPRPAPIPADLPDPDAPASGPTNVFGDPAGIGADWRIAATPASARPRSLGLPPAPVTGSEIPALPTTAIAPPHQAAAIAEPVSAPQPGIAPRLPEPLQPISARTSDPASLRIHIGTIEVRTTPPPAPQPSPPAAPVPTGASRDSASVPVSRGYGWRFGLSQG